MSPYFMHNEHGNFRRKINSRESSLKTVATFYYLVNNLIHKSPFFANRKDFEMPQIDPHFKMIVCPD